MLLSEEKMYIFIINQEEINKNFKYNWFNRFSIDQIFSSNLWINYLFKKALNFNNNYYYTSIFDNCNYDSKNCNCDINFGRFNCKPSDIIDINEYEKVKSYKMPPESNINLLNMLQNCNYFSTPPWISVYNSSSLTN